MITLNNTRKKFLIISSAVWIILTLGAFIYIYPEKRNDHKLGKKELVALFKKEKKHMKKILRFLRC
jgi:hypothetical protein